MAEITAAPKINSVEAPKYSQKRNDDIEFLNKIYYNPDQNQPSPDLIWQDTIRYLIENNLDTPIKGENLTLATREINKIPIIADQVLMEELDNYRQKLLNEDSLFGKVKNSINNFFDFRKSPLLKTVSNTYTTAYGNKPLDQLKLERQTGQNFGSFDRSIFAPASKLAQNVLLNEDSNLSNFLNKRFGLDKAFLISRPIPSRAVESLSKYSDLVEKDTVNATVSKFRTELTKIYKQIGLTLPETEVVAFEQKLDTKIRQNKQQIADSLINLATQTDSAKKAGANPDEIVSFEADKMFRSSSRIINSVAINITAPLAIGAPIVGLERVGMNFGLQRGFNIFKNVREVKSDRSKELLTDSLIINTLDNLKEILAVEPALSSDLREKILQVLASYNALVSLDPKVVQTQQQIRSVIELVLKTKTATTEDQSLLSSKLETMVDLLDNEFKTNQNQGSIFVKGIKKWWKSADILTGAAFSTLGALATLNIQAGVLNPWSKNFLHTENVDYSKLNPFRVEVANAGFAANPLDNAVATNTSSGLVILKAKDFPNISTTNGSVIIGSGTNALNGSDLETYKKFFDTGASGSVVGKLMKIKSDYNPVEKAELKIFFKHLAAVNDNRVKNLSKIGLNILSDHPKFSSVSIGVDQDLSKNPPVAIENHPTRVIKPNVVDTQNSTVQSSTKPKAHFEQVPKNTVKAKFNTVSEPIEGTIEYKKLELNSKDLPVFRTSSDNSMLELLVQHDDGGLDIDSQDGLPHTLTSVLITLKGSINALSTDEATIIKKYLGGYSIDMTKTRDVVATLNKLISILKSQIKQLNDHPTQDELDHEINKITKIIENLYKVDKTGEYFEYNGFYTPKHNHITPADIKLEKSDISNVQELTKPQIADPNIADAKVPKTPPILAPKPNIPSIKQADVFYGRGTMGKVIDNLTKLPQWKALSGEQKIKAFLYDRFTGQNGFGIKVVGTAKVAPEFSGISHLFDHDAIKSSVDTEYKYIVDDLLKLSTLNPDNIQSVSGESFKTFLNGKPPTQDLLLQFISKHDLKITFDENHARKFGFGWAKAELSNTAKLDHLVVNTPSGKSEIRYDVNDKNASWKKLYQVYGGKSELNAPVDLASKQINLSENPAKLGAPLNTNTSPQITPLHNAKSADLTELNAKLRNTPEVVAYREFMHNDRGFSDQEKSIILARLDGTDTKYYGHPQGLPAFRANAAIDYIPLLSQNTKNGLKELINFLPAHDLVSIKADMISRINYTDFYVNHLNSLEKQLNTSDFVVVQKIQLKKLGFNSLADFLKYNHIEDKFDLNSVAKIAGSDGGFITGVPLYTPQEYAELQLIQYQNYSKEVISSAMNPLTNSKAIQAAGLLGVGSTLASMGYSATRPPLESIGLVKRREIMAGAGILGTSIGSGAYITGAGLIGNFTLPLAALIVPTYAGSLLGRYLRYMFARPASTITTGAGAAINTPIAGI
jgi:hypothetical protein